MGEGPGGTMWDYVGLYGVVSVMLIGHPKFLFRTVFLWLARCLWGQHRLRNLAGACRSWPELAGADVSVMLRGCKNLEVPQILADIGQMCFLRHGI